MRKNQGSASDMKQVQIIILAILLNIALAQSHVPRRVLIQKSPEITKTNLRMVISSDRFLVEKELVKQLGIFQVKILDDNLSDVDALAELRRNPWIKLAQFDHLVSERATYPDDSQFGQQWDMHNDGINGAVEDADIDAPEAWDITTGGLNPLGDTIVVAVVDGGCALMHPDLAANLWTNRHEIPGNNIDDDNNGYIDDIHGWDAYSSDGSIPSNYHGTHVSGTVGAIGNNGSQVSGVNWNVKIMEIAGSGETTSIVLAAYGYVLAQRTRYNETNGDSGAFVVSTNSSFGVDYADCASGSYPLWNEIYTAMGEAGILSAAATMNHNADVDVTGDVPTGCDSDYLITVTNTTSSDSRNSGAAYGATTIDLGAPGTAVLSTIPPTGTGLLTGTSMATPHVAGAVGFLHAAMSHGFASFYRDNPGEGALALKQLILDGTDPLPTLNGVTVSGGRLNLFNSAVLVGDFMAADSLDPNPVTDLTADTTADFFITLNWQDPTHLFGGDTLTDFVINVYRNEIFRSMVGPGFETFTDGPLPGAVTYLYSLLTRDLASDSTSVPASITVRSPGGVCVPGDATHDGNVDVTDVIKVLRIVLGYTNATIADICTADMDNDGQLTVFDILAIVDLILTQ